MVSDRNVIEVQYPGIARVHGAPTHVRFQNVAVNFQFWIKNDEDARGGDVLGGRLAHGRDDGRQRRSAHDAGP